MSSFIVHGYPKWAERTMWGLRIASYAFCTLTGIGALIFTPASLTIVVYPVIASLLIFGAICMCATVLKRYIIEWISLFFLSAGISFYVASVWILTLTSARAMTSASIFTVLLILMLVRIVELTVFWQRNARAARLQLEMKHAD